MVFRLSWNSGNIVGKAFDTRYRSNGQFFAHADASIDRQTTDTIETNEINNITKNLSSNKAISFQVYTFLSDSLCLLESKCPSPFSFPNGLPFFKESLTKIFSWESFVGDICFRLEHVPFEQVIRTRNVRVNFCSQSGTSSSSSELK